MFRFSVYTVVAIGVIFAIALSGLQANAASRARTPATAPGVSGR